MFNKFIVRHLKVIYGFEAVVFKCVYNITLKVYYDWLKKENSKDEFAKLNPVLKLSENEIEEEVHEANKERFIHLPKKYLEQKYKKSESEQPENVRELSHFGKHGGDSEVLLKVEVPEADYKPGAIYKLNNCYYDSNGDFLYKVASNT